MYRERVIEGKEIELITMAKENKSLGRIRNWQPLACEQLHSP
jgi:hypothetical protein